jgi:hypothetical protein
MNSRRGLNHVDVGKSAVKISQPQRRKGTKKDGNFFSALRSEAAVFFALRRRWRIVVLEPLWYGVTGGAWEWENRVGRDDLFLRAVGSKDLHDLRVAFL